MNVFILGPTKSGKTVLAACLYQHIVLNRKGKGNFDSVHFLNEGYRTLPDVGIDLLSGNWPRSDLVQEAHFYQFSFSKGWLLPDIVDIEIVDYGGEHLMGIPEGIKKYRDIAEETLEFLENHGIVEEIEGMDKRMMDKAMKFHDIKNIYDIMSSKNLFDSIDAVKYLANIVVIYLISKIHQSDKLVLLLDGNKVKNFIECQDLEINRDCRLYADIMQIIGEHRDYAAVITKADVMDNLDNQFKNRRRYRSVNKWLKLVLNKFENNAAFIELTNIAPLDCFGVCLETFGVEEENKPIKTTTLPMWGYSELMYWIAHG